MDITIKQVWNGLGQTRFDIYVGSELYLRVKAFELREFVNEAASEGHTVTVQAERIMANNA